MEALENTISILWAEVGKLKPENVNITKKLEVATASLEAVRSQVASPKGANATQQGDIPYGQALWSLRTSTISLWWIRRLRGILLGVMSRISRYA